MRWACPRSVWRSRNTICFAVPQSTSFASRMAGIGGCCSACRRNLAKNAGVACSLVLQSRVFLCCSTDARLWRAKLRSGPSNRFPRLSPPHAEIDGEAAGASSSAYAIRLVHYVPGHDPYWPQRTRRTTKTKAPFRAFLCFLWLPLLRQGEAIRSSAVGPADAPDSSLNPSTNGLAASSPEPWRVERIQQRPAPPQLKKMPVESRGAQRRRGAMLR